MSHSIALDIGGTTTTIGLVHQQDRSIDNVETVKTQHGLKNFPVFFGNLVKKHLKNYRGEQISINPTVCIGLPGNFAPGSDIRPHFGSARQLLLKNEEFPSPSITKWLRQYFPETMGLFGVNDALAQAVGAMQSDWRDDFQHKVMVYIGPGTGLGGAILSLGDGPEQFEIVTDGHLYDIMVRIRGQHYMAEDVFSGRGIFERSGVVAKELSERDDYWNQHQRIVDDCIECAVQIIGQIRDEKVIKAMGSPPFMVADMKKISDIGIIMLGGSIGTQGRLGIHIAHELRRTFSIPVVQSSNPIKHALLGALALAQ